jgi:predicted small lipoprotein YifL
MIRAVAVLACLLLAACGQKGALYLPDAAQPVVVSAPPAAAPASADDPAADQDDADQTRQQQGAAGNAAGN